MELGPLLIKLSAVLGASFLIERFLVIISTLISRLFVIQTSTKYTKISALNNELLLARRAADEEEILRNPSLVDDDPAEIPVNTTTQTSNESYFDLQPIKVPDEVLKTEERFELLKKHNAIRKEFWLQVLGTAIAITVCYYYEFSIWISDFKGDPESMILWKAIFTGVIIGGGSKPINFLMNFLINRKVEVVQEEVREKAISEDVNVDAEETIPVPTPKLVTKKPPTIADFTGFNYKGGNRPGRLENTHLFKTQIDLIVYHHTAMSSNAPFEELVKEFDRKGWLTGYNCVVFKDGTIRALCRWDRFGNHALPHNAHSLGIAMQGNFETNPDVPYSNHDGRYGLLAPTTEQVDSTARITALWSLMHNIKLDFPKKKSSSPTGIIPHNLIAAKACPGNNFPYASFEQRVSHYHQSWVNDDPFKQALEEFKLMPYVMPWK